MQRKDPPAKHVRRILLCGPMVNIHIVYPPVTQIETGIDVLSRKVVRDSIRGISELRFGPVEWLVADGYYSHSERGHSVCILFSVVLQKRADSLSQSSSTERRHQADFRDCIRRYTPSNGGSLEDCMFSSSEG